MTISVSFLFVFCAVFAYVSYIKQSRLTVDPDSYKPLLLLIAKAESNDNYNAYFTKPDNDTIKFTQMSVAEVANWQSDYLAKGNLSSAVGRYQIINSTLQGLTNELEISANQNFDQATQDKMAIKLLERRGAEAYINEEITGDEFAENLSKEWAALPKTVGKNPEESYYASDGINQSRISVAEVKQAIDKIRAH